MEARLYRLMVAGVTLAALSGCGGRGGTKETPSSTPNAVSPPMTETANAQATFMHMELQTLYAPTDTPGPIQPISGVELSTPAAGMDFAYVIPIPQKADADGLVRWWESVCLGIATVHKETASVTCAGQAVKLQGEFPVKAGEFYTCPATTAFLLNCGMYEDQFTPMPLSGTP